MKQIQVSKRQRPVSRRAEPPEPTEGLRPDPRDPDIVRAKELARRQARKRRD